MDVPKTHQKEFPKHNIISPESKNIEDNFNAQHPKCVQCKKNLKLKDNNLTNYCDKCKGNLCDVCKNTHNSKYPKHIPVNARVNFLENPEEEIPELPQFKCLVCQKDLSDKVNEPIANCNKCKGSLCPECSRSHKSEFPRHRLENQIYIPKLEGGKDNKDKLNKLKQLNKKEIPNEKCKSCKKDIKENEPINYCTKCNDNLCKNCNVLH